MLFFVFVLIAFFLYLVPNLHISKYYKNGISRDKSCLWIFSFLDWSLFWAVVGGGVEVATGVWACWGVGGGWRNEFFDLLGLGGSRGWVGVRGGGGKGLGRAPCPPHPPNGGGNWVFWGGEFLKPPIVSAGEDLYVPYFADGYKKSVGGGGGPPTSKNA